MCNGKFTEGPKCRVVVSCSRAARFSSEEHSSPSPPQVVSPAPRREQTSGNSRTLVARCQDS